MNKYKLQYNQFFMNDWFKMKEDQLLNYSYRKLLLSDFDIAENINFLLFSWKTIMIHYKSFWMLRMSIFTLLTKYLLDINHTWVEN